MKKYIIYITFAILFILLCITTNSNASTGSTVFIGEPVILNDYNNIEITYNKVDINEETSEINNLQLFTNLSSEKIVRKASIKLEDSYSSLTINSLKIKVNDLEIQNFEKVGDEYVFYFEIFPNEGKKIEITYKTDSDLQNAKIIKYTMDKLKGKDVKLFQINVKLSKYDIPLVQKIWPGAYEYDNNTVSTEYFDFKVNNLTSNFIIQKETYKNLKYGEYAESLSDIDEYVLNNIKEFMNGNHGEFSHHVYKFGKKQGEESEAIHLENTIANWVYGRDWDNSTDELNRTIESILEYTFLIEEYKNNTLGYTDADGKKDVVIVYNSYYGKKFCLATLICNTYTRDLMNYDYLSDGDNKETCAVGKMVAINYYETEQGKDLYVNKDTTNSQHGVETAPEDIVLMKRDEYSILRTIVAGGAPTGMINTGIKRVYVNSDIDGNKIDITEEEIVQFVNMMNIDLYIRIVLYDPSDNYPEVTVGYYSEETKEIAEKYGRIDTRIAYDEKKIKEIQDGTDEYYSKKDEKTKQEQIEKLRSWIENSKKNIKLFDNEVVKNYCKIPVVAHCVGTCKVEEGKYVIDFNNSSDESGLLYIYGASECDEAKQMLEENQNNNDTKRNEIVNKITNTKVTLDTEEYKTQEEIITNENNSQEMGLNVRKDNGSLIDFITKNPIILGTIIIIFVLILILILFIIIRITRGKKNGRK
ncbi:MAG: hypothetical protein J6M60_01640 [Clostridia bacterium]|nr:hypothetical protein [Clostridia bacterium]